VSTAAPAKPAAAQRSVDLPLLRPTAEDCHRYLVVSRAAATATWWSVALPPPLPGGQSRCRHRCLPGYMGESANPDPASRASEVEQTRFLTLDWRTAGPCLLE